MNDFKFKIEIIKTENGYKDNISVSGTELETLGAIEKTINILIEIKNKILSASKKGKTRG